MRILFSFISITALLLSWFFFYRVGGAELVVAVVLLVLSIHLEMGLRVQESVRFVIGIIDRVNGNRNGAN